MIKQYRWDANIAQIRFQNSTEYMLKKNITFFISSYFCCRWCMLFYINSCLSYRWRSYLHCVDSPRLFLLHHQYLQDDRIIDIIFMCKISKTQERYLRYAVKNKLCHQPSTKLRIWQYRQMEIHKRLINITLAYDPLPMTRISSKSSSRIAAVSELCCSVSDAGFVVTVILGRSGFWNVTGNI